VEISFPYFFQLASLFGVWGVAVTGLAVVLLLWQLFYWAVRYNRIPSWRSRGAAGEDEPVPGVSVVVRLNEDYQYLEQTLPLIMAQDHPAFELVVVYVGADEEFRDTLDRAASHDGRITVTQLNSDTRFAIGDKMAYNLGIKAARYENILLATCDTAPASERWLRLMARGFARNSGVVIGYCAVARKAGWANKIMRIDRLALSVRFLSAAMRGKPYRGMTGNLALTKGLYFGNKGFNHLDMNIGEDDLYVQQIAGRHNTAVILNPGCTTLQEFHGSLGYWWTLRAFYGNAVRLYPARVQVSIALEAVTRVLFFASCVAAIVLLPDLAKLVPAAMLILRFGVAFSVMARICRRLGEQGLKMAIVFYDLVAPFVEFCLWLRRRFNRDKGVWR